MTANLTPRQRFAEIIRRGESRLDLAEAALVIAQEEYPLLSPAPYLAQLDDYGRRIRALLAHRQDPVASVRAVNQVLFKEEKYRGNDEDYYDPHNSFLNEVMDRKLGIPITLSVLYMEAARRAGLPVAGVGLPGHFIVAYLAPSRMFWLDPFDGGRQLSEKDCEELVTRIYSGKIPFHRDALKPVPGFSIVKRLLFNLKNIYIESNSHAKALSVIEKLLLLDPGDWLQVRDRGILWYHLRSYKAALADLENFLKNVPQSEDRQELLKLAAAIGRRLEGKPEEK